MTNLVRLVVSFFVAAITFGVAFLAIFVPLLIRDMHYAPHDGQGGMGGFFIGLPVGALSALVAGLTYYAQAKRRNWFSN
jgi:hypothetical protein